MWPCTMAQLIASLLKMRKVWIFQLLENSVLKNLNVVAILTISFILTNMEEVQNYIIVVT